MAGAPCTSGEIGISLTHTGAAAGSVGGLITFTNHGASACKLTGFPGLVAVTAAGQEYTVPGSSSVYFDGWTMSSPKPVVSLAPGQYAYADLSDGDNPVGTATSCPPPYVKLRVAIPGGTPVTISAFLPGLNADLPSCKGINGTPDVAVSAIGPASDATASGV